MKDQSVELSVSALLLQSNPANISATCQDREAIIALSQGQYRQAERYLLCRMEDASTTELIADRIWLLCQLYSQQLMPRSCTGLVRRLSSYIPATDPRLQQLILQKARQSPGSKIAPVIAKLESTTMGAFPHLDLEVSVALLQQGYVAQAETALVHSKATHSCEGIMLKAQLLRIKGERELAETLLLDNWQHFKHRLDYSFYLIELLFELRRGDICIPALREAITTHGCRATPLLERLAQARMQQRMPAVAMRLKLQERLPMLSGAVVSQPTLLSVIYDSLGRSDWLSFLPHSIEVEPSGYLELHCNRLMHLSSRSAEMYQRSCQNVVKTISQSPSLQLQTFTRSLVGTNLQRLRVGWVCGDIANHPVARFLLSWLAATDGQQQHEHLIIGTTPGTPRYETLFKELSQAKFIDHSQPRLLPERIKRLRQLNLDLAIDLNGWTGNHLAHAFIARIAPLQLNYLAYHASTGIPAMDIWLVDQHILPPEANCEWHTEHLLRLPRPFLAWQPHPGLPEAAAGITQPAFDLGSGIRFGCFNHVRKISDEALRCWAHILRALPSAQLVLKAHSTEDSATAKLLQRRLERSGLPPEQVIWLPYTDTPDQHLQQYAQMDVALDSFPNTGCTTTCEALWMGVPVITLEGDHYVSRMAAAVLHGAGLPGWICSSTADYEELAMRQAEPQNLAWLREHRGHWRKQLQQSPLGDARDLMRQLESSFSELALRRFQEQTFQLATHPPRLVQG